jgi:hypothetical protein
MANGGWMKLPGIATQLESLSAAAARKAIAADA